MVDEKENHKKLKVPPKDKILIFGKRCKREIWDKSEKPSCLIFDVNVWVNYEDMTD